MTTHFALEEFLYSDTAISHGIANSPSWEVVDCLKRLAEIMEEVRAILAGRPIEITSGYRCPDVNRLTGGATDSAHLSGLACDFVVEDLTPHEVCLALEPHMEALGIDQLIWEYESWVHLGLSAGEPRHQCLTINDSGTSEGFA